MPTTTPNLGLTYLAPSQSQPEVPINANWDLIDAAVHGGGGGGTGPAGPAGPAGADGPAGPAGPAGTAGVYFGAGAPTSFHGAGALYFDTSTTPLQGYVQIGTAAAAAVPSVDGTPIGATFAGANSGTLTISTSAAATALIVIVSNEAAPTSTIEGVATLTSASGLAFTRLGGGGNTNVNIEIWAAPLTAALAGELVTVTLTANADAAAWCAFGMQGIVAPFSDPGPGGTALPAIVFDSATGMSITNWGTTYANDFLLQVNASSFPESVDLQAGWTHLTSVINRAATATDYDYLDVAYSVPGAVLTGQTLTSDQAAGRPVAMLLAALTGAAAVVPVWRAIA